MSSTGAATDRSLLRRASEFSVHLTTDFLGGPRLLKLAWAINGAKLVKPVFVLALMSVYLNDAPASWVYFGLSTIYCFSWVFIKHFAFPDPNWEQKITFGGFFSVLLFLGIGQYWVFPFLMISDFLGPRPPPSGLLLAAAIFMHTLGVVLMMVSDAQKHFVLKVKKGLIVDGMFKYTRNPNYLGDMMVYSSWALLIRHWIPWVFLLNAWVLIFVPRMIVKDASISRYPGWDAYKAHSGMLFPWPMLLAPFTRRRAGGVATALPVGATNVEQTRGRT